ncbi:hypothetical protein Drose_04065 [Dactylosporangium roseum]|uniref:HTH cro/C1-type domain-containing protein n=1 Tax=Dactylosporangium roseum TaxID=47989 RepID=A0ABY5Z5Z4_9ACTN|nr:hypothetical protein [Dactylosporangium roseum]UWZ37464.1 hypothetical protein Drose_04065 [Dactylosporangium roseum]
MTKHHVDPEIDQIAKEHRLREQFTSAGDDIRYRLEAAEAMRRGALIDAGSLTTAAQKIRDERGNIGVDVSQLADRTDVTRPTLYKYAAQASDDGTVGALTALSTAALARLHLDYGFAGHEGVAAELWARYPNMAGWYRAYRHLASPPDEEFNPWDTTERQVPEAAKELCRRYREWVEKLAAGPLES